MALKGVLRLGYIQLRVTDLKAVLAHYVDRVGLHEVSLVPVIRGPVHTAETPRQAQTANL